MPKGIYKRREEIHRGMIPKNGKVMQQIRHRSEVGVIDSPMGYIGKWLQAGAFLVNVCGFDRPDPIWCAEAVHFAASHPEGKFIAEWDEMY